MPNPEKEFKYESLEDRASVVKYFSVLGDGLARGALSFKSGVNQLSVTPKGLIRFHLRTKRRGDRVKLELKLSWKEPTADAQDQSPPLTIDPGEGAR